MNRIGQVTGVNIDEADDKVYVDVAVSPTEFEEGIRFRTPGVGVWFIPEEDDIVEVKYLGKNRAVAHSPYNVPDYGMPSGLEEGDIAFRLNSDTVLKMSDDGTGTYDVNIECDGDLTLDGNNIFIGENGSPVATADHTHDFTQSDGGTSTTETENEAPTNTEIE